VSEDHAVPVEDLGCRGGTVVFQGGYVGKVGKGPGDPDGKEEHDKRKDAEGCEKGLLHGARLLLPVHGVLVLLIPSTDGTGVDASTAAAAPERADDKKENNADEDIEELIVGHNYSTR